MILHHVTINLDNKYLKNTATPQALLGAGIIMTSDKLFLTLHEYGLISRPVFEVDSLRRLLPCLISQKENWNRDCPGFYTQWKMELLSIDFDQAFVH